MDYEKLHKDTIAKLQEMVNSGKITVETARGICADFVLESEDERIRKHLITLFKNEYGENSNARFAGIKVKDIIAWLEKQGEKKPVPDWMPKFLDELRSKKNYFDWDEDRDIEGHILAIINWMNPNYFNEKDGEQKSADKVGSKFKVGDWLVQNERKNIVKVVNATPLVYEVVNILGYHHTITNTAIENNYHLWTIQDAKDGDVLATLDYILIFKEFLKNDGGISYCHYDFGAGNPQFIWSEDKNWYFGKEAIIHPATKEQRDLLFKKMHEAGYEWNADKKELKKIDNEEFNGEDYGIDSLYHAQRILEKTLGKVEGYQTDDGILAHQCAISAIKKLYEQKPWSEEDERKLQLLIAMCDETKGDSATYSTMYREMEELKTWLNSFKDRVQPKQDWREIVA